MLSEEGSLWGGRGRELQNPLEESRGLVCSWGEAELGAMVRKEVGNAEFTSMVGSIF